MRRLFNNAPSATCANASPSDRRRREGFALVTVIWGLSLIAVLIVSFMSGARLRLQAAYNMAGAAKAELIARAAIDNEMLSLIEAQGAGPRSAQQAQAQSFAARAAGVGLTQRTIHKGEPRFCEMAGAAVAIAVEDEAGKVDLNGAPPELLKAVFIGFGLARDEADRLAKAIVVFRSASGERNRDSAPDGGPGPKQAPFQTIYELDQVPGLQGPLLRDLLPIVTIYSRRPGVDAEAAPPALFAALAGFAAEDVASLRARPFPNALDRADPRFPRAFKQNGDSGTLLIHTEALLQSGQISVLEAVVTLGGGAASSGSAASIVGGPFAILELRKSSPLRFAEILHRVFGERSGIPEC